MTTTPTAINDAGSVHRPRQEKGPLAWLATRRNKNGEPLVSREEVEAGERLARDFYLAIQTPRVTANWSVTAASRGQRRAAPGVGIDLSDRAMAARAHLERALLAVGRDHAGLLLDVCCYERGLSEIEQAAGWPRRSGKLVLQMALRQLARHYGILADEAPPVGSGPIRHWGTDGYRPDL